MSNLVINRIKGLTVALAFVCAGLTAQSYNDAVIEYNKGVANYTSNVDSAIIYFTNCIRISEQAGDTATDIKMKAIQVLPDLYYQKAYNFLTVDKNYEAAIEATKEAKKVAVQYENDATIEKCQKALVQAYLAVGAKLYSAGEYDKAIMTFDSVLAINADHSKAILNKALAYKKMDDIKNFGETIDLYLSKLDTVNDAADVQTANKLAMDFFRVAGGKANKANNIEEASSLLNRALQYGTDDDVCYQMAVVLNKQKKYTEAADFAQKGIDLSTDPVEKKAKFYYELGVAQSGLGQKDKACETFKNAMYGPFLNAAKGQQTNLKCGQ